MHYVSAAISAACLEPACMTAPRAMRGAAHALASLPRTLSRSLSQARRRPPAPAPHRTPAQPSAPPSAHVDEMMCYVYAVHILHICYVQPSAHDGEQWVQLDFGERRYVDMLRPYTWGATTQRRRRQRGCAPRPAPWRLSRCRSPTPTAAGGRWARSTRCRPRPSVGGTRGCTCGHTGYHSTRCIPLCFAWCSE